MLFSIIICSYFRQAARRGTYYTHEVPRGCNTSPVGVNTYKEKKSFFFPYKLFFSLYFLVFLRLLFSIITTLDIFSTPPGAVAVGRPARLRPGHGHGALLISLFA